jgi:hypothetical protein
MHDAEGYKLLVLIFPWPPNRGIAQWEGKLSLLLLVPSAASCISMSRGTISGYFSS